MRLKMFLLQEYDSKREFENAINKWFEENDFEIYKIFQTEPQSNITISIFYRKAE